MAEYQFRCGDCQHEFTLCQSMHTPRPKSCPKCRKRKNFGAVIGIPIGVRGEPRTVGSLAEKNTKKLSKEAHERIMTHGKSEGLSPAMRKRVEEKGGVPLAQKKPTGKAPWYRNGSVPGTEKSDKPIDLSGVKDMKKFIETGKKS